ncbi:hypothetical protein [Rhodococcus sp. B10]|uniref:hypothetical protein n=1 Tax=Rhodococcus sp. B10 TaxID=2695876 RepID=UPI001431BCD1|nr:hypothetical protein [Rhodococcus sp. B10]NIL77158.1 hypothetical protein [Rhodococcus sp. B10]
MSEYLTDESRPVRTGELTEKIWHRFGAGYTKLTQVRAATGHFDANTADMMVMGEWPSTGNELHGFEVKVSRADWLNEVKNPHKNDSVKSYCDRWWLVIADESMVRVGELPDDWGMMAFQGRNRKLKVVKKAPKLAPKPMDHCFVASLLRHNDKDAVPIDLHLDRIRDAYRDAEVELKTKHHALFEFVRTLSTGFGVRIKEHKEYDYSKPGRHKIFSRWIAEIKGTYLGEQRAEDLVELLQKADRIDSIQRDVEYLQGRLQQIIADAPQADQAVDRAVVWAEYALKHCDSFLGPPSK